MSRSLLLLALACASLVSGACAYNYDTRWFDVPVDNFNFLSSGTTFPLRYLVNAESYESGGPIFFYTGNEGPIDLFANNTGFVWEIAPQFNALLVWAEHRYYGESLPFGQASFTNANYQHLSAEQALADYALLLSALKSNSSILNLDLSDAQVISFGGSYGGMLSAWFRYKYPHVVAGSIAASAPIWFFDSQVGGAFNSDAYNWKCSQDFKEVSQACFDGIAASWNATLTYAAGPAGFAGLSKALNLCPGSIQNVSDIQNTLWPWIANVYQTLPMADYPTETTFLGALPAWPVNETCKFWTQAKPTIDQLIASTYQSINLFYNYTGQYPGSCFNFNGPAEISTLAGTQWNYQACTEMVMPQGQQGPPMDFFYPSPWDLQGYIAECQAQFGVTPQPFWILTQYGGPTDWADATNIVFSNGNLDPWSTGGVLKNLSATVIALPVVGGAHHLDLRASSPSDPPGVTWARQQEIMWIHEFLRNPSPANPPQYVEPCNESGLTKEQTALVSIFVTLGVCIITFALYLYCTRGSSNKRYLVDTDTRQEGATGLAGGPGYNSMGN